MAKRLRALLYLATAVALAPVTFGVLLAGWLAAGILAITPAAVPVLVAFRWAVRRLATLEAWLARRLLGSSVRLRPARGRGRGFWAAGGAALVDAEFWRQQVFLTARMLAGSGLAIGEVTLLGAGLGITALPAYYSSSHPDFGVTRVDSLAKALACLPIGLAVAVFAFWLLEPLAAASRALAGWLLGGEPLTRGSRRLALGAHAGLYALLNGALIATWAATTGAGFWPEWTLIPLALPLAMHAWVELVAERPRLLRARRLTQAWAIDAGVSAAIALFLVAVWLVTGHGYPWPVWPAGALALLVGAHALALELGGGRIRQLERTRAGAVEAQETKLRRIERDLHDGAQARLVAVGMTLGLAEQQLHESPEAARALLAEARAGMGAALVELRDLARGIHPPILADRGIAAALVALADRSALPVEIESQLRERLPASVETAAYFVAAESIANAAKHADATAVHMQLVRRDGLLELEVRDDGHGGADPEGRGLRGLRQRVEALDGTLAVDSPPGGPTTVRAELPCAS